MDKLEKIVRSIDFILKHVHEGIVIADREGRVIYVNEANERITGLDNKKILGQKVIDVVPTSSLIDVLKSGKERLGVKTRVNNKYVYSNIVPIYESGVLIGSISVFLDLTEIQDLNQKLESARQQINSLSKQLSGFIGDKDFIVGRNPKMQKVLEVAKKAAGVISSVLITGESGTGKEVVAKFIHNNSPRKNGPFIEVNCSAIPETLLESELFGYEPGAFTGADPKGKTGLLEKANGGTIFLDEIGDMPFSIQAKLLRVLQDSEIRKLGGGRKIKLDIRVISATNRSLEAMVESGEFREDFYYRLNVIHIELPPLRERSEDIPVYAKLLMDKIGQRLNKKIQDISPAALRCLINYHFPGNIRELENILEKGFVMDEDGIIGVDDLPEFLSLKPEHNILKWNFDENWPTLQEAEKAIIERTLKAFPNKTKAAKVLGISRATLYRKMEEMGLDKDIV
ncbi:sigma-54 interaction domain-containing protein [Tepidanaerobacter syntrophicus]|uniref:sigma-54 interaction domain-containing protein n=1 Tax=Tepidanaerobacter syntrophicus TaxID=224999 RepID=UPI001BD4974D|nr:sigma 54-interacting transcriptional regulator [Tepidanaerobacter syntrophicus]